ncbi:MAG: hypothetical protein K2X32_02265 [Phycisphaerales bacterium]|nr:hypothetical protein [Phycisphaerales bacterium]
MSGTNISHDDLVQMARRAIRVSYRGTLLADAAPSAGHMPTLESGFAIDPGTGLLAIPAGTEIAQAGSGVLCTPEERCDALQLTLHWKSATERDIGMLADYWTAYHGNTTRTVWLSCTIKSAKLPGGVVDGDELALTNTLAGASAEQRRRLNADRAALAEMVRRRAGVPVESPLVIGVDDWGVDVRAEFGVIRVEFGARASASDVSHRVDELLRGL